MQAIFVFLDTVLTLVGDSDEELVHSFPVLAVDGGPHTQPAFVLLQPERSAVGPGDKIIGHTGAAVRIRGVKLWEG